MVRTSRSSDSHSSRGSSTGSTRSTVTVKTTDTSIPRPSRRNSALSAMIYFAGGNPNRVRAVRHNQVTEEWDEDYDYWRPTETRHQMYFVSAKQDWYSDYYDDGYRPAPRRPEMRRGHTVPGHHHHGGPPPGPRPMGGPGGPMPMGGPMGGPPGPNPMMMDDSSSDDDDGSWDGSQHEYGGMPPMGVGPEFGDAPFPHPGMMHGHPQMMHPQGHFAGPPMPPPPQHGGGDSGPGFVKLS